jgi:hypothetical protein
MYILSFFPLLPFIQSDRNRSENFLSGSRKIERDAQIAELAINVVLNAPRPQPTWVGPTIKPLAIIDGAHHPNSEVKRVFHYTVFLFYSLCIYGPARSIQQMQAFRNKPTTLVLKA